MTSRIGEADDPHFSAGACSPLGPGNHGRGDPSPARSRANRARKLSPGLHPHLLERGTVIVERVTAKKKPNRFEFLLEPFGGKPGLSLWHSDGVESGRPFERELKHAVGKRIVLRLRQAQKCINRGEHACAVWFKRIESTGGGKAFQHALVEGA